MRLIMSLLLILSFCMACDNKISEESEPVVLKEAYRIDEQGDLYIARNSESSVVSINALVDSHILEDDNQQLLILTDPTDQYQHGILGDSIEASSVTIIDVSNQAEIVEKFSVANGWVIESIRPIWRDWDGDGNKEIVLTISNNDGGAKLVLYDEKGNLLAESDPVGLGYRWRHALDIAAFGQEGQMLLVDVITPHIGGIVNFYSWDKNSKKLVSEASLSGYSTHDIGSRSVHMFEVIKGEDQSLLVIPSQSKTELAGLRLQDGDIIEVWRLELGGKLSGDLKLVTEGDKKIIKTLVDFNRSIELIIPE